MYYVVKYYQEDNQADAEYFLYNGYGDYSYWEESYDEFGFKVERDVEDTRMNLFFNYVPESGVRELLKKNEFKWSPNRSAWTRQLTPNAEASLRRLVNNLKEYHGTEI